MSGYFDFLLKLSSSSMILSCVFDPNDGFLFRKKRNLTNSPYSGMYRDAQLFDAPLPEEESILTPSAEVRGVIGFSLLTLYLLYRSSGSDSE